VTVDKKKAAAERAVEFVQNGMIVGLGTGSTANFAIEALGKRVKEGLEITGVATSSGTEQLAKKFGVPLLPIDEVKLIDITIDGADEVDPSFNLIKGMGGALFREKVVAYASLEEIIIVDDSKLVDVLGIRTPLPVEVAPFGHTLTRTALEELGCQAKLKGGEKQFKTDSGNLIYECKFERIDDPEFLEIEIHLIPGVIETGLFIDLATKVVVGQDDGTQVREKF
jgi:ribose 5-phosphate isomerase A